MQMGYLQPNEDLKGLWSRLRSSSFTDSVIGEKEKQALRIENQKKIRKKRGNSEMGNTLCVFIFNSLRCKSVI